MTGEFPAQKASYEENVSIWWRHHDFDTKYLIQAVWTVSRTLWLNLLGGSVNGRSWESIGATSAVPMSKQWSLRHELFRCLWKMNNWKSEIEYTEIATWYRQLTCHYHRKPLGIYQEVFSAPTFLDVTLIVMIIYADFGSTTVPADLPGSDGLFPPLDKMAVILQTVFSDAFSWMKSFVFWLKFHWSLVLGIQLTIIQHYFR